MASIVFADDGIEFDGRTPEVRPLGGSESALIGLAEALAARGHTVAVYNGCRAAFGRNGVAWRPIGSGTPESADLFVAYRGHRVLALVPRARARAFFIQNPARYLLKWRYLAKIMHWQPVIVFTGAYHLSTYPRWAPGRRAVMPMGVEPVFLERPPASAPPPPRAAFTSNPLRGLDWLLDLWSSRIHPMLPGAELHVFSGAATYGAVGDRKAAEMASVLERARALSGAGVVLRGALAKPALADALSGMRAWLYRGDEEETFCFSAAEAQAMGVPGVVGTLGSLPERIEHGRTGFVAASDSSFVEGALALLGDDALWRGQHAAALARRGTLAWSQAASAFEALLPR